MCKIGAYTEYVRSLFIDQNKKFTTFIAVIYNSSFEWGTSVKTH